MNELHEHEHIVFGSEHYNPLGVVRSLGENGIKPVVFLLKSSRDFVSKSKYVKKTYKVDSLEEGFDVLLNDFSNKENKSFIYFCDDTTLQFFDANYEKLKDYFYFFNAGKKERISFFMDKHNINVLAIKHGLNVLKETVVTKGEVPEDIEYPIITKAINSTSGGWKDDVFICENKTELEEAYKKIKSPTVLLQKYLNKKNELCLDGFSYDNGKKTVITIASSYNYILPDRYSPFMTVKNFDNSELNKKISSMIEEIGFEGIFSVEFLVGQNDELYFCEINFRNSTWSYASTCMGMPLPILWSQNLITDDCNNDIKKFEPFFAMVEFNDLKTRVLGKKCGWFTWFKDFLKTKCKFYFGKRDIKPVISYLLNHKK